MSIGWDAMIIRRHYQCEAPLKTCRDIFNLPFSPELERRKQHVDRATFHGSCQSLSIGAYQSRAKLSMYLCQRVS